MENIYEVQNALNIQYGVVLEESGSSLTQGGTGSGTESRFAWRWPY